MLKRAPAGGDDGYRLTPLVVVELAPDAKEEAIAWLLNKIRDQRAEWRYLRTEFLVFSVLGIMRNIEVLYIIRADPCSACVHHMS